jgi:hypothetical protein
MMMKTLNKKPNNNQSKTPLVSLRLNKNSKFPKRFLTKKRRRMRNILKERRRQKYLQTNKESTALPKAKNLQFR